MSKKDLSLVTTNLAALAEPLPTQRPASRQQAELETPAAKLATEEVIQFNMALRKSLRKQLARMADEADMTMRAYVLNALKEKGLDVSEDDLVDRRKGYGLPVLGFLRARRLLLKERACSK